MEIESGRMSVHRHLLFIKIHASDALIQQHAEIFFYTKYFNDMHKDLMPGDAYCQQIPFLIGIFPFVVMCHERAYLAMMRNNYPNPRHYSTLDRSRIVYDLLTNATFRVGKHQSVCLKQLMQCGIVVDIYALHDGPYFLLRHQIFTQSNGRQILYEFWIGFYNFLKVQPLYIINEYFGERIGFFFAFYGLYNMWLIILMIAGVGVFLRDWYLVGDSEVTSIFCGENARTYWPIGSMDVWETTEAFWDHIHWERKEHMYYINYRFYPLLLTPSNWVENFWFCPNCRHYKICPYRREYEVCEDSRMNDQLETTFKLLYLPIFCFFWAALFLKFWKRTEKFYSFMWEIDNEYVKNFIRCHCQGVNVLMDVGIGSRMWKFFWNLILLGICFMTALLMLYYLLHYRYYLMYTLLDYLKNDFHRKYYVTMFIGIINMTIVYTLERMSSFIVHKMICFEQLESNQEKEETVARRLFGVSFIFTFVLITYVAFAKGKFNTTPVDRRNLKFLGGILMDNCDPLTCIDEVLVLIIAILCMRELVFKFIPYIRVVGSASDYSIKCWYNRWPYWERERLMYTDHETECFLEKKFKEIIMQFASVILFIGVCPLAPALALLVNAFDLRHCARRFIVHSRRPLIRRAVGIGPWREILVIIVFLFGLFGTMLVTVTSDFILKTNLNISTDTDILDHVNYQREHVTYPLFTQVNGVQGDVNHITKIGHIPLALFPEYDYLIIFPDWFTTTHTRGDDPVLYSDFEKYVLYSIKDMRSPCYGWYYGCHFKSKIRVGCLWRSVWGQTYPTNSPFTRANCTLVYDTTVRRHCYMKGFMRRVASVTRRGSNMYSEEITMKATTRTEEFTDKHNPKRYDTTWSTTSDTTTFETFTWSTFWWNYTTSWFDTSYFRSWYFSWFEIIEDRPTIAQNNLTSVNNFLGRNITEFYKTTWIFVPYWATSWFTTTVWYTGYYWSWYKNTTGEKWNHMFSTLITTDTWKFTLQYYADVYHSYGYATNWQQFYITHQKWWYTVCTVTLLTIILIIIYHCWPDLSFEVRELFATEKNLEYSMVPKMKFD